MAMESQAEALNQLTTDDLEGKVAFYFLFSSITIMFIYSNCCLSLQFALLESSSVDDDLAKMKRELSGSSLVRSIPLKIMSKFLYGVCDTRSFKQTYHLPSHFPSQNPTLELCNFGPSFSIFAVVVLKYPSY